MTVCDYDGVFYRVFCVTLLAIAFTFTVILTNVFVDIDGLLVSKERDKKHEPETANLIETVQRTERVIFNLPTNMPEIKRDFGKERRQETPNDMKTFEDEEDASYRAKRSLESTNFHFRVKEPKIKNILTTKLASLLEELDNEETGTNELGRTTPKDIRVTVDALTDKKHLKDTTNNKENNKIENDKKKKELLHLTMHNILLQGIIGHMELSDVYKKVHILVQNMDLEEKKSIEKDKELQTLPGKAEEPKKDTVDIENMFLEELIKCAKLQKQIKENNSQKSTERRPTLSIIPKMLIKTVIDVNSLRNDKSEENDTNPKEIRGVFKLFYNGKAVKLKQSDVKDVQDVEEMQIPHKHYTDTNTNDANKVLEAIEISDFIKDNIHIPNSIINKAIFDYFSKNANILKLLTNTSKKRSKRNVKVRDTQQVHHTTEKNKIKIKNLKSDDDELYVEIETHFDGKGIQGEKKRQLIKNIIGKIQKVLHSDTKHMQIERKPKKYNLKKRFQAPLDNRDRLLIDKFLIPFDAVVKRELTPISKSFAVGAQAPNVYDKSGESWKKMLFGPRFLSASKGINSAELGEVDVHYDKVHSGSMTSPRMQKSLNTESVDDRMNNFYELGNLKFYIKDLDGSGFSIGFNQFVGETPDDESINTFTGVENLLQSYRTKYIEEEEKPVILARNVKFMEKGDIASDERNEDYDGEDASINRHKIKRRNVDENSRDHHSNEYKIIFSNNFLPYDSYQEVIEDRNKKASFPIQKEKCNTTLKKTPSRISYLMEKTIFDKELKPSDIFSLANLIDRNKRSIKLKKYTKINIGNKISKYLNSNRIYSKIFLQNKPRSGSRFKRQVEKIRIVATDNLGNVPLPRHSDENIYLVSDENIFSDHPVVREIPEEAVEAFERPYEDVELPAYAYEDVKQHAYANAFNGKARHNILMSKYPHVFMEEILRSKEEERETTENVFSKHYEHKNYDEPEKPEHHQTHKRFFYASTENPDDVNNVQDIVDAISPRTNYKLTVKILPKNSTSGEGFKEIHTSINKSISKNGVIISSQLNVSEISKIVKVNQSKPLSTEHLLTTVSPIVKHIKIQNDKMNTLLKQHKQRIEEQLENLNKERQTIDTFMVEKPKDLISVWLPTNPAQIMQLTKDEAGQLIKSALLKLKDAPHLNELGPQIIDDLNYINPSSSMYTLPQLIPSPPTHALPSPPPSLPSPTSSPSPSSSPSPPSPTSPPSPPPPLQSSFDLEKMKLINTILRNENLTKTILTKIDKNTQMLQSFLQKLTYKFEIDRYRRKNEEAYRNRAENVYYSKDVGDHLIPTPLHGQTATNFELEKNDTHVSIPFVYAYQQSFPLSNKANVPVASVVYQGHIHANAISNKDLPISNFRVASQAKRSLSNDSRFFLDALDNEFKALPIKVDDAANKNTVFTGSPMPLRAPLRNSTSV